MLFINYFESFSKYNCLDYIFDCMNGAVLYKEDLINGMEYIYCNTSDDLINKSYVERIDKK